MGTVVDSLFTVLMSWVRALVNGLWALFAQESSMLAFLGKNWLLIAVVLIAVGLVIDWLVWLVRWQPYHIWAQRVRRLLRIPMEEDGEKPAKRARPAVTPAAKESSSWQREWDDEEAWEAQAAYAAYEAAGAPAADEEEEAIARAEVVPDEELGAYPGMLYDDANSAIPAREETQRYSALTSEGPGAAEVARRREEIDAYRRAQEEAEKRARAEREARMEAERMAERTRREEEARREEAARLAQEAYARELAEYEIKRAQYERDLAEYERQKAEYDAQQERLKAEEEKRNTRRRRTERTYSDYVDGEAVGELPDAPQWPQVEQTAKKPRHKHGEKAENPEPEKKKNLMNRMSWVLEGEEDGLASLHALPPRVDMHEAYRPAKTAEGRKKTERRKS